MSEPTPLTAVAVPLLNPNEPDGLLAALHVREGQPVRRGDPLFTLETTKSTAEVEAERDGYVVGLRLDEGRQVRAGDLFCYLADRPDATLPLPKAAPAAQPPANSGDARPIPDGRPARDEVLIPDGRPVGDEVPIPDGLRITQPALALARRLGLNLQALPRDRLVTESIIAGLAPSGQGAPLRTPAGAPAVFDPTAIIVYGGGGHGKSVIDLLRLLGVFRIAGVIDDGIPAGTQIMGLAVLGGAEALPGLYAQGVRLAINAVGGISNLSVRLKVFQTLTEAGFTCPAVAHPSAVVEASAVLEAGVQVFAQAYVGSEARLGYGAIVNTGAILSHDCVLGEYANVSPGAILAGEVRIGAGALIGMGATVNLQVHVGAGARVGNGATVKADVPENGVVRAGSVWPG